MTLTWKATGALCLAVFCQTYLFISVFTYSGFLAMFLDPDLTNQNAGSKAGLISSSYMFGRLITSYAWGRISDKVGRKPVFYVSFILPGILSILFGLSTTMTMALGTRFFMGFFNALMLIAKTCVSELAKGDNESEARGMGLVMGMWGFGFLICPAISGVLSDPVKQFPNSWLVENFGVFLTDYPFILPNLVSVLFCTMGTVSVFFFVQETLPDEKRQPISEFFSDFLRSIMEKFQGIFGHFSNITKEDTLPLTENTQDGKDYGSEETKSRSKKEGKNKSNSGSMFAIFSSPPARAHVTCFWIMSFISTTLDEAFPLFCIATRGGLGINETDIGKLLSGAGLIFVLLQFPIYSYIVSRFGIYGSLLIGCMLATPLSIIMPFSLYLDRGKTDHHITYPAFFYVCAVLGIIRVFNNVATASVSIGINRSVPADQRATVNGLSQVGNSLTKALGPITAGFLVSSLLGDNFLRPEIGTVLVFTSICCGGLCAVYYVTVIMRKFYDKKGDFILK